MDQISPLKKHTRPLLAVRAHQPGRLSRAATIFLAQKGRGECSSGAVRRNETRNTHKNTRGRGRRPLLPFFFRPRPPTLKPPPPSCRHTRAPREARAREGERGTVRTTRPPSCLSLRALPILEPDVVALWKTIPRAGLPTRPASFFFLLINPWPGLPFAPPSPPPPLALVPPPPFEARRAPSREALRRIAGPRGGVRARAGRAPNAARYCVCARACLFFEIPKCHRNQSKYYLTFSFSRALSPVARGERVQRARDGPPRDAPRRRSADISQLVESNRNRGSLGAAPLPHWHRQPTRP